MDKESDVIKHQMEHTRAQLTDKLELLEHQVADTVTGAAETVEKVRQTVSETVAGATETVASVKQALEDTVQSVKDTVRETAQTVTGTLESVGETLDLRRQVEKHPWAMVAGATAVGFGVGVICSRVDVPAAASSAASSVASSARSLAGSMEQQISGWTEPAPPPPPFTRPQRSESQRTRDESHEDNPWMPAVNKLKGLAIGAMFGVLRDVLSKNVPSAI